MSYSLFQLNPIFGVKLCSQSNIKITKSIYISLIWNLFENITLWTTWVTYFLTKQTPDSWDWKSHLLYSSARRTASGLLAQPSPVHNVHPWLHPMTALPDAERIQLKSMQMTPPSSAVLQTTIRVNTERKSSVRQQLPIKWSDTRSRAGLHYKTNSQKCDAEELHKNNLKDISSSILRCSCSIIKYASMPVLP